MNLSKARPEETDSIAFFGAEAIREQAWALQNLALSLDDSFERAVQAILSYSGHLVISGMGKSGLVGRKMAATFASTGTPSFFVHPAEAVHGDLGMIRPQNLVMLISHSGETDEILNLLPSLKRFDNHIIAMVGQKESTLGREADIVLTLPVERETCPHNLAPTTSTLVTMSLGDALAVTLMRLRGFQPDDFALYHPCGALGRRLLCRVQDVMHKRSDKGFPIVAPTASVQETIWVMTRGRMGLALIMEAERLQGIITDGDLRRAMMNATFSISKDTAADIMHRDPVTIGQKALWSKAEQIMSRRKIKALVALDEKAHVTGVVEIF
ncbi:MAG: KpsF/GutQ family sugar-phosphate isomerase [Desulfobacterales bacterium]|jgi:arabinose-5-phosphate isomerase